MSRGLNANLQKENQDPREKKYLRDASGFILIPMAIRDAFY